MSGLPSIVPLRRPDLVARRVGDDGMYRVEDAIRGAVYRLGEPEHFLLTQCDGRTTTEAVRRAYAERFGQPLSHEEMDEFLRMASQEHLLMTDTQIWKNVEDTWWGMSPRDGILGRAAAIEQTADARLRKYRRFFWEYDRHSHPLLTDLNPDIPDQEKPRRKYFAIHVWGLLTERVLKRAEWHRDGRIPGAGDLPTPADKEAVPYLSRFQLDLIRRCLPGPDGGIDLDSYGEAFEMFGNGELRVDVPDMPGPSEPNSGNLFSFGEFAFLAIEEGVDVAEWSRLLNPLVRIQRIFMTAYRPEGPPPYSFCDYRPANLSLSKQVDAAFKRRLREEYAGRTVEQLAHEAGRNASHAFAAGWRTDRTAGSTDQLVAEQRLASMIGGYLVSQAICVAAQLGIADRLRDGPRNAGDLARETGTPARPLSRLLRTLTGFGIFAEEAGRFRLTALAEFLRSDVPGSLRAAALTVGETHYSAFGELLHSVRTGQPGFDKVFGMPLFDYFALHPEAAQTFDAALAGLRAQAAVALLDVVDFSDVTTLVDVGGGTGSLLAAVLARYPSLKGVLFDLPPVVERALDIGDRCTVVGGDFFESVPAGGDVYLLRHILHDWDDNKAIRILRNCRDAMAGRGRLLVVESVIRPGNEPSLGKTFDLVMLALTGGMERTEEEYRDLLDAAGFYLSRVIPTAVGIDVLEAEPR